MHTFNPALPNRTSADVIRIYCLQRAAHSLQAQAGYIAPLTTEPPVFLEPIAGQFAACADMMMTVLCSEPVEQCNPRVPYVVMLYILLDDYRQRTTRHPADKVLIYRSCVVLLQIILGSTVTHQQTVDISSDTVNIIEKIARTMSSDLDSILLEVRNGGELRMFFQQFETFYLHLNQMNIARRVMLLSSLLNNCYNQQYGQVQKAVTSFLTVRDADSTVGYSNLARLLCQLDDEHLLARGYVRSIFIHLLNIRGEGHTIAAYPNSLICADV
jgi:hypothetical protein